MGLLIGVARRGGLLALGVIASLASAAGCVSIEMPPTVKPKYVAVLTEGVTIYDESSDVMLRGGADPMAPPWYTRPFGEEESQELSRRQQERMRTGDWTVNASGWVPIHLDDWDLAVRRGARPVRIRVPGRKQLLYGVLSFEEVFETAESAARRAYRVEVPEGRVAQAMGARISLVYGPYDYTFKLNGAEHKAPWYSWVLWMSDAPFADHDPNWTPPSGD